VRLVLDTNTAISGLLWHGTPGKLIDAARTQSVLLCTSAVLLAELRGVLTREKFAMQLQARSLSTVEVFDGYAALTNIVIPAVIPPTIINDPSDDAVLACALGAKAELIISGDRHLLDLKEYQDIRIVTAVEAVRVLSNIAR
jgi:putative PIN family toxin of toxin-antitoxin system